MEHAHDETVTWRLLNLDWQLDEDEPSLRARAAHEVGLEPERLRGFRIAKKALDARKRGGSRRLRFVGHVDLIVPAGTRSRAWSRLLQKGHVITHFFKAYTYRGI